MTYSESPFSQLSDELWHVFGGRRRFPTTRDLPVHGVCEVLRCDLQLLSQDQVWVHCLETGSKLKSKRYKRNADGRRLEKSFRLPNSSTTHFCFSYKQWRIKTAVHWLRVGAVIAEFNMGGYVVAR